jgi:hypothetical protein
MMPKKQYRPDCAAFEDLDFGIGVATSGVLDIIRRNRIIDEAVEISYAKHSSPKKKNDFPVG